MSCKHYRAALAIVIIASFAVLGGVVWKMINHSPKHAAALHDSIVKAAVLA